MVVEEKTLQGFEEYLVENEKADNTVEKYVRDVRKFFEFLKGCEITKAKALEYKKKLVEEHSPTGANSVIAALNCFFDYAGLGDMKLKSLKVQKRIFASREKELSKGEYERLLKTAMDKGNKRLFLLMQTICSTGIRVSEVRFVSVEAVKDRCVRINCKGKLRVVMLPKKLCKMLEGYIKEEKIKKGSVFVTKTGKPLDRSNVWSDMKKLCEDAGVDREKVFPHNLRHLFARVYYSIEKDIVRLSDILGHSSVNTTRIYTMETGDIHRRQIERLGLLRC